MNRSRRTRLMVQAALIAALYAALTLLAMATPVGALFFGQIQVRIPEALTILPFFTPAAIPGLFIGCLVSNLVGATAGLGCGVWDVIFGSLATLLAAWLSSKMPKRWLVPLPPVLVNAVVVGSMLHFVAGLPWAWTMLTVGLGQAVACYGLGYPLLLLLDRVGGSFLTKEGYPSHRT
jgi:uncharacterized membrane protein